MQQIKTFCFGVVEWINRYQAYGWAVFILIALLILLFGGNCYAILQNEDRLESYKIEQESVHERMIKRMDNLNLRLDTINTRYEVMNGKLDLIIQMNTK